MNRTSPPDAGGTPPSFVEAAWTWGRVAVLSFGGPAGQIAVMHRILVEEKRWISEERFLHALNFCMLLPGPEAQQLATYIGWLMHGVRGGLFAGTLFILPGAVSILILSLIYTEYQQTVAVQALFFGLKPAVLAIVFEAVQRIGRRVLKNRMMHLIAIGSFVLIFFFRVPFPVLVCLAGVLGYVGGRLTPDRFLVLQAHGNRPSGSEFTEAHPASVVPTWGRSLRVSLICLSLWFGPLAALHSWLGPRSVYLQQGLFFSKAACVTFGGAYALLAYVQQQAVDVFQWVTAPEMLDGLGMAETTPGPLIMVVQFVAFLGAYRNPGPFSPLTAGIFGSVVTIWVTFVPCFYWIFLGAPYIEQLRGNRQLSAALSTITAAVVGVVMNLAVWFSMHTLFSVVRTNQIGWLKLEFPEWSSVNWGECVIAAVAMLMTFRFHKGMVWTLLTCLILGVIWHSIEPTWTSE